MSDAATDQNVVTDDRRSADGAEPRFKSEARLYILALAATIAIGALSMVAAALFTVG
ncbi:MAG: hypothetical protein ACFCVK_04325 [Acidimicrobiales bacterium]